MGVYKGMMSRKRQTSRAGKAVILFKTVKEGILAEKVLLKKGYSVRKVAPPAEFRKGCEISVEIDFIKKEEIIQALEEYNVEHQGIVPLS
jgi:hypothetical protein